LDVLGSKNLPRAGTGTPKVAPGKHKFMGFLSLVCPSRGMGQRKITQRIQKQINVPEIIFLLLIMLVPLQVKN
jgi:hypothetical protein